VTQRWRHHRPVAEIGVAETKGAGDTQKRGRFTATPSSQQPMDASASNNWFIWNENDIIIITIIVAKQRTNPV